ncbi:MAG: hypothetical protein ABI921_14980 [Panacibacter sp.]
MMGRTLKNIRGFIEPVTFFIPFTYYFFLFAIAAVLTNNWLAQQAIMPDSSFGDIFKLLLKTGFWFIALIIIAALLSAFVSFIIFLWKKRKNGVQFSVTTTAVKSEVKDYPAQRIHIVISPLLKPLLGFIKLRLQYDEKQYSEKFALVQDNEKKFISLKYAGDYQWNLPEIKEYHVEKLILYFEDLFQFFSFTVALPVEDRFHTNPFAPPVQNFNISPRKTEDTSSRIEELKKVEGEYLNYKNFENNDDVRRIVWKIYAKNKELVVRIPEVLDPSASHAYIYPSFFNVFDIEGNSTAEVYFLNYYKTMLWGIYTNLSKQGFVLRYIADQQTPSKVFTDEQQDIQYNITTSNWQQDKGIKDFVNAKDASVVVLSSLCNAEDVATLLESQSGYTMFVLIKLSNSLQSSYLVSLLQWIFIQQEKNELEVYKTNWRLSLLRSKVANNEKKLEALLAKHSKTLVL